MNNLAYNSQQPEKVAPQVEEKLRKEIDAAAPIPYQVEGSVVGTATVNTVMTDLAHALFGGQTDLLFMLVMNPTTPRRFQLQASATRQGIGCHIGTLLYSTRLSKPVSGEAALEAPRSFGTAKFTGDSGIIGKLNANGSLLKRIAKFARTESQVGGLTIKAGRMVKVMSSDGGAMLAVSTLPRTTSMGFDATLDAKEFLEIAALVEATL